MEKYDVVIIGAGPAGGQCARELSQQGFKILIVDKAKSFLENNYSSGGAPLSLMQDFSLPDSLIGTYWNTLRIYSTKAQANWTSSSPFGPVIEFNQLKTFLIEKSLQNGVKFHLNCQYQNHQIYSHAIEAYLKDLDSSTIYSVQASVIVDATGTDRKVLAQHQYDKHQAIAATGIEYHVDVDLLTYQKYSKSLNFFLGHQWMPQGYGWIFPMSSSRLKVGVIRYFQNKNYVPYDPSYKYYLEQLLKNFGSYQIQDKHGKTLFYTPKQKDLRYRGPILAVGDAISTVNPLGWEGIRHAMHSGRFAAQTIQNYLKGEEKDLSSYDKALHKYFTHKWFFSEKMMNYLFKNKKDFLIDQSIISFSRMNNEEIMRVIFGYQFRYVFKSYFWYLLARLMHANWKKDE